MDLTVLKGKIVIFQYGTSYKGYRVNNETPKKFEYDTNRNYKDIKPDMIMKNTIIYVSEDRDEVISILKSLNEKSDLIKKLSLELRDMKHGLQEKAQVNV